MDRGWKTPDPEVVGLNTVCVAILRFFTQFSMLCSNWQETKAAVMEHDESKMY